MNFCGGAGDSKMYVKKSECYIFMPQNVKTNDHKRCKKWQACAEWKENIFERTMKISTKQPTKWANKLCDKKKGIRNTHRPRKVLKKMKIQRMKTMDDQKRANE